MDGAEDARLAAGLVEYEEGGDALRRVARSWCSGFACLHTLPLR